MKTLTKERLVGFLVKHGACKPGLDWAQSQESARDIVKRCLKNNWLVLLIWAIGGPMLAEYCDKRNVLLAEYNKKECLLWAEYWEKKALFRAEYEEKEAPIWAEYEHNAVQLWAEYREKCYTIAREICTFERVQEVIGS